MSNFVYQDPFPLGQDTTKYRRLEGSEKYVSVTQFNGDEMLKVDPEALKVLNRSAAGILAGTAAYIAARAA